MTTAAALFAESAARLDSMPAMPPAAVELVAAVLNGNEKITNPKRRVSRGRILEVLRDEHGVLIGGGTLERWVRQHFNRRSWAAK